VAIGLVAIGDGEGRMTTRRGFLKALAAVPATAAMPARALSFGGAANIGAGVMGGAAAAGAALGNAASCAPAMSMVGGSIWALFNRADDLERARVRWLDLYRTHRIMARKGLVKREPAKLIWLREELRRNRHAKGGERAMPALGQTPFYAGRRRVRKRIEGRVRAKLKLLGFPGMPWEAN
jgi:hypothetical protein